MTEPSVALAMFQPDQAGNVGAAARLAACFGTELHLIEPMGFPFDDRRVRRAGMDYLDHAAIQRHVDWMAFERWATASGRRLVLLTTRAAGRYDRFGFDPTDVVLVGRESGGVPEEVHARADARITIPMRPGARSLNVAMAAGIVVAHAAGVTGRFDRDPFR